MRRRALFTAGWLSMLAAFVVLIAGTNEPAITGHVIAGVALAAASVVLIEAGEHS